MIDLFPSDYSDLYMNIMNNDVCGHATDFFIKHTADENCKSFFANSTSYVFNN